MSQHQLKIALVHEWVAARAGSEKVFEQLAAALPSADLFTLSAAPGVELNVGKRSIQTSFLDNPYLRDRRGLTLPIMPLSWAALGVEKYDVVVTSHHAFAHSNRLVRNTGLHLAYVHSPARYVWTPEVDGRGSHPLLAPARAAMRRYDKRVSQRITTYAANSSVVAARIRQFWERDSRVIFPPVDTDFFETRTNAGYVDEPYLLGVGRFVTYERMDLVIKAAEVAGVKGVIAGSGPDERRLRQMAAEASVPIEVLVSPTDIGLRELMQRATALIFPTEEDFGIVPVEAQAAGTPVIAPAYGGALDTVIHGKTGFHVPDLEPQTLARAAHAAQDLDSEACRTHARQFSIRAFHARVEDWFGEFGLHSAGASGRWPRHHVA